MNGAPGGLDVVVVNHRTPTYLANCLASIEQYAPKRPYTVTVVQTCPELEDMEVSAGPIRANGWHEIVHPENVGYNRACNHAAAGGTGDYIAFMNADAATTESTFDALCGYLDCHPRCAVIGPRQVDSHNRITAGGIIGDDDAPRLRSFHHEDRGQVSDIRTDVVYVAGSFVVVRRSAFDQLTECESYQRFADGEVGPWGTFAHYAGDDWLGRHARAHGWAVTYYGAVCAIHEWHRSTKRGGYGEQQFQSDQALLREMCADHKMICN